MDKLSLERIKLLHPKIRQETLEAYKHINNKLFGPEIRLRLSHTLRSFEEQDELFSFGRTKLSGTDGRRLNIITNAKAGQSMHNYGLAFDIVILTDKGNNGGFETASWNYNADDDHDSVRDWQEAITYLKNLGWTWGGDWKSFPDRPHFEKTFGHSHKSLLQKYTSGDIFTEVIDGKIYKWVNL